MPFIGICDDEKEIRDMLVHLVTGLCPKARLGLYASGDAALEEPEEWDILFLDIQMPGTDGMEIARRLRKRGREAVLIFVTALEEYVFEAFDVSAFHYLVKPFSKERFEEVFRRALAQCGRRQTGHGEKERPHILVKAGGTHIRVLLEDILYAEVYNRKVMLHKRDGDLEYYGRISDLEKELGADFMRPHRSYLVHLPFVEKYDARTIYLEDGSQVPMAKQKYPEFVQAFLRFHAGRAESM